MANFRTMKSNLVQSIRANSVQDLQTAALEAGHRFFYASLAKAQQKQEILDGLGEQFKLQGHYGKNFDALYDCMTDTVYKSGGQNGFVVVVEHIPCNAKFDKEAREQLLDIFRDVAEYWGDRKIAFRCFYSYSVARASDAQASNEPNSKAGAEKLLDISPLALRMASPFNAGYWLAAAQEEEQTAA